MARQGAGPAEAARQVLRGGDAPAGMRGRGVGGVVDDRLRRAVAGGGRLGLRGPLGGGREGRLGQRRGEDRGDLGTGGGRRGAAAAVVLGPYGLGDPGPVEHPAFVGLGDQVLGLVVVAVGGLDGPQMHGDTVFLGRHQAGQQIAVAGHQDHIGAGAVSGQLGEFGVHRGVDALLRPPTVTAGECPQSHGHPRHDPQPAVFGLGYAVGGAVEPVDPQQRLRRIGLGPLTQALDQCRMVDGDAGTGGLSGQQTRGCSQQIAGVHQDDATVHAFHPLPEIGMGSAQGFLRVCPTARGLTAGTRSSAWRIGKSAHDTSLLRTVMIQHAGYILICESDSGPGPEIPHRRNTMAKNKNRKQSSQQDRVSPAERGAEEAKSTAYESQMKPQSQAQGSPADVARKHQRRFGHN